MFAIPVGMTRQVRKAEIVLSLKDIAIGSTTFCPSTHSTSPFIIYI